MTEWSQFDLKGWTFVALMPDSDVESQQWTVKVTDPTGKAHALFVPMDYAPRFGPDVSDIDRLNDAVEDFIKERGIE